ncbi:hypothetical protein HPB49_019973 [Dermacentor silvarum]|uniref:Uncharacterized protein n=1 Tax=Dermacentor silvarum TaxID=543639 RepID=A0ACB8CMG4_DERSI|nr:hypothetical protein HPB49_019973 [Dermacentor silvarum]
MAGYASPPQFEEATGHLLAYLVWLEDFFEEDNGLMEEIKKRALLVAGLSTHFVAVVIGRCAPTKVNELYNAALDIPQQHFSPSQNEIAQSDKFFSRNEMPGDPVRDFLVANRQLPDTCNVGTLLDMMLRDRTTRHPARGDGEPCGIYGYGDLADGYGNRSSMVEDRKAAEVAVARLNLHQAGTFGSTSTGGVNQRSSSSVKNQQPDASPDRNLDEHATDTPTCTGLLSGSSGGLLLLRLLVR